MSAGGGLAAAGRLHSNGSAEIKTGFLDILLCYRVETLTLEGLENKLLINLSEIISAVLSRGYVFLSSNLILNKSIYLI